MSTFPTGRSKNGQPLSEQAGLETDGVLVRPISGQIYLIEESDLENLPGGEGRSPFFSGLISRH